MRVLANQDNSEIKGASLTKLIRWKESLASCAIEGNKYAQEQLELWHKDRAAFITEYLRQEQILKSGEVT